MISVLELGTGNFGSILNMLRYIGAPAQLISTPAEIQAATKILLPGVGSFDNAMNAMRKRGLITPLKERVLQDRVPLLGICLGMQLLGLGSEEGSQEGLGLIAAHSRLFRFPDAVRLKVPHMGWNQIKPQKPSALLDGLPDDPRFYFVHSYHVDCQDRSDRLAQSDYGIDFTSMVERGNIAGAQFHPEKSHKFGMALLKNFSNLPRCSVPE